MACLRSTWARASERNKRRRLWRRQLGSYIYKRGSGLAGVLLRDASRRMGAKEVIANLPEIGMDILNEVDRDREEIIRKRFGESTYVGPITKAAEMINTFYIDLDGIPIRKESAIKGQEE